LFKFTVHYNISNIYRMGYDSNGFNYKGNSVLEKYDTSKAGFYTTKSSGFSKNNTDIARLITPAFKNGAGTSQTHTKLGNSYIGFASNNTNMNFDTAFAKTSPSFKAHIDAANTPLNYWSDPDDTKWKICHWDTDSSVTFTFPRCLSSGSASSNYEISPSVGDGRCYIVMVGGGGGGGTSGTWKGKNLHPGGPGGGGGGTLLYMQYYVKAGKTLYFYPGAGGGYGDGSGDDHYTGKSGGTSEIKSDNSNRCYAYGGQGGRFDSGSIANPGGSTGGGHAWSTNIHSSGKADDLTGDGYSSTFGSSTTGQNQLVIHNIYRNKGGKDTGYGWGAGGGGGAGGTGGNHKGAHNRDGGDGGAAKTFYTHAHFGGGGGGGGELNLGGSGADPNGYGDSGMGCGGKGHRNANGENGSSGGVLFRIHSDSFSTGSNYTLA
jgi:hypothetical protein